MNQWFIIPPFSLSRETPTCSEMTTDRDAIYDESTDEDSEIPSNPSVLTPGKVNTYISFDEYLTGAYFLLR